MTHVLDAQGRIKEYWGSVALADLDDYAQGRIIMGGAVDWTVLNHPGATANHLQTTGAATLGWSPNIVMADGAWTGIAGGAERIVFDAGGGNVSVMGADFGVGTLTVPHGGVGYAKVAIEGTDQSSAGPHVQFTTHSDDYPLLQLVNWKHDSVYIYMDAYFDGAERSSDAGSNVLIRKDNDRLDIRYDSGIAAGNVVAWNTAWSMDLTDGSIILSGLVTMNAGLTFGGASGVNDVVIPDNQAIAFAIEDDGAAAPANLEYMRIVTTNAGPAQAVIFNNGEVDVDFRVAASGITSALFVEGSSGYVYARVGLAVGSAGAIAADRWMDCDGTLAGPSVFGMVFTPSMSQAGGAVGGCYGRGDVDAAIAATTSRSFWAGNPVLGGGATLTNAYAYYADAITAATNNWGLYILGTQPSYILGPLGIGTLAPSRILDCNDGSGNMIADGYDNHPSWLTNKVDPEPMSDVLTKFKQVIPYQYKRIPYVSADELAAVGIKEFGKERWEIAFPDSHRGGELGDCPDPEIKAFLDQLGDELRAERQGLPEWQRLHYGLAMDDLVDTFPDILSRDPDGSIGGYSLNNYVGLLHACIAELLVRVERLE